MPPNILFPFQSNGIFSGAPTFSHSPLSFSPLWTTFSHRSHSFLSGLIQRVVPGRGIVVPELRRDKTTGTSIGHARHRKTTVLTVTSTRIRREGLRPCSTVERCTRPNPPPVVATTQLLSRSRSPLSPLRHVSGWLVHKPWRPTPMSIFFNGIKPGIGPFDLLKSTSPHESMLFPYVCFAASLASRLQVSRQLLGAVTYTRKQTKCTTVSAKNYWRLCSEKKNISPPIPSSQQITIVIHLIILSYFLFSTDHNNFSIIFLISISIFKNTYIFWYKIFILYFRREIHQADE